ncbi:hypothetical protein HDV57DRAFT_222062 [Trichoderma longibrachiatum]
MQLCISTHAHAPRSTLHPLASALAHCIRTSTLQPPPRLGGIAQTHARQTHTKLHRPCSALHCTALHCSLLCSVCFAACLLALLAWPCSRSGPAHFAVPPSRRSRAETTNPTSTSRETSSFFFYPNPIAAASATASPPNPPPSPLHRTALHLLQAS